MIQSNAAHPGLHPPQLLHNPRTTGLIVDTQKLSSNQPRHHSLHSSHQSSYASPQSATAPSLPSLPQQHPSPYIGALTQHQADPAFFPHPSPYSVNSAAGSFASSDHGDHTMATQAAMSRQSYPPMASYQTPQSNSPASIHSPHTDHHGRQLYSMPAITQHPMYYTNQYHVPQQSPYTQHPPQSQPQPPPQTQMGSAPGMMVAPHHHQQSLGQHQHSHMMDNKTSPATLQRPPSQVGGHQQNSPQTPGPAPGPIPATTPLVVRQDNNGVQWIAFEYSRDRVKMEYTIRCDVESVNVDELTPEFKTANCVYPRACVNKESYKGNRLHYESECNAVGWALAQLNPNLREKRGLIQRAVDSWRNSNQDVRLRSRRVRRMAKMHNRKHAAASVSSAPHMPGHHGPSAAMHHPVGLPPVTRPGSMSHHGGAINGAGGHDDVSVGNDYGAQAHHHVPPTNGQGDLTSPTTTSSMRYTQNFYPSYPTHPGADVHSMPPLQRDGLHTHASTLSAAPVQSAFRMGADEEEVESKRALFGEVPESKRRKFILVDDNQRGGRVRVRVMLDQVKMDDMPDAHLRINAVYPRSYYPRQMRSPPGSPGGKGHWDDEDDVGELGIGSSEQQDSRAGGSRGKSLVPVSLMDGTETRMAVPKMVRSRRAKEVALNELGYRMAWGQARTFNGRTLFLQRSLDAYRNKMRSTMIASGDRSAPSHFETRPGKRKWLERSKRIQAPSSP